MYKLAVWLSAALDIGFLPLPNAKRLGTLCSLAYNFIPLIWECASAESS